MQHNQDGYALLETLIALALVTIITVAAGTLLGTAGKSSAKGRTVLTEQIQTRNSLGSSGPLE